MGALTLTRNNRLNATENSSVGRTSSSAALCPRSSTLFQIPKGSFMFLPPHFYFALPSFSITLSLSASFEFGSPTSRIPPVAPLFSASPWSVFFTTFKLQNASCAFPMATRNMHSHFPKRKSSATAVTSSKVLSAASYKSRDSVYGAFDDIGSGGGTVGAGDSQPAALVSSGRKDLNEEYDDVEEILRQFDMNMAYGPCLGVSRLERFERARRFGLNPPLHVKNLLERVGGNPDALWEGRV